MEIFNQLRKWWLKQADPRSRMIRDERKKADAMAKRLDNNERKYKKP